MHTYKHTSSKEEKDTQFSADSAVSKLTTMEETDKKQRNKEINQRTFLLGHAVFFTSSQKKKILLARRMVTNSSWIKRCSCFNTQFPSEVFLLHSV